MFYNSEVTYIDKTHQYFDIKTGKQLTSVTTDLKRFVPQFDENKWSGFKAEREGVSQYRKKLEWHLLREHGTKKGSYVHEYIEHATQGKYFNKPVPDFIYKPAMDKCLFLADKFIDFYRDTYDLIASELIVSNGRIAGQVDNISKKKGNKTLRSLVEIDIKTDKGIKYENQYANLLDPYGNMPDTNYSKYQLQLNTYKKLFEDKYTGHKINEMFIVWIYEENNDFEIIKIPKLKIKHL